MEKDGEKGKSSVNEYQLHNFLETSRKRDHENDIELSLGLSLNGRFGDDPKKTKIQNHSTNSSGSGNPEFPLPARACSLPTIAEEEWREVPLVMRLEPAEKNKTEKMKNIVVVENEENENCYNNTNAGACGMNSLLSPWGSQGSTGSSWMTDLQKQQYFQGLNFITDQARPLASGPSKEREQINPVPSAVPETSKEKSPVLSGTIGNEIRELLRSLMHKMPCVSTRGDGPNGKKVEGFLYEGDEVKIVCTCHGTFLSPAEFIQHAGGIDIENPLRHIVVNPKPFAEEGFSFNVVAIMIFLMLSKLSYPL